MLEKLGVELVKIDLPFRLNHVNCFLAEGNDGMVIIDAGLHNETAKKTWLHAISGREISNIYITHSHPDHYGYAGELQKLTGAKVWMTKKDADTAATFMESETVKQLEPFYQKCGVEEHLIRQLTEHSLMFRKLVTPHATVNQYFNEYDKVQIGRYEYDIIFTPGHSDGLICFYNKENNVLFSTDHILPSITPNISLNIFGESNPLANYLESLKKVKALEVDYVIPSHGLPFQNANSRIAALLEHHQERISFVYEITKQGINVIEACKKLFKRELTVHEIRFAIGETLAHLEYLYKNGDCTKEEINGCWVYKSR